MYLKPSLMTIAISSLISANIAIANPNQSQVMFITNPNVHATTAYWTPERMRDATPMDLPKANPADIKKVTIEEIMQKYKYSKPGIVDAAAPTVEVTPDTHQIFKPQAEKLTNTLDAGSLNEQFSSQRLVPVTADLTYPYSTAGKLFFTTPTGNKTCSGAVIGKRLIVTAGHCMHNGNGVGSGYYSNFMFVPAYRNGTAPYQEWQFTLAGVTNQWYYGGGIVPNAYDYGMFLVADQTVNGKVVSIGSLVGTLGIKTLSTIPNHAHILGFPGNLDGGNEMHQVTAQSAIAVAPNNAEYGSDMSTGAGGGPWIQNFGPASTGETGGTNPGRNFLIGLTSYGYNDTVSLGNGSPILDSNFISFYDFFCAQGTGNC